MTVLVLAFVIYFIVKEALPTFQEVSVTDFLFGQRWMPIAYTGEVSFGIFNFIMATLYVSFLALAMAILVGIGAAIFLSCVASERMRGFACGYSIRHLWIYRTGNFGKIFYSGGNSDRFLCSGSRDFAGNYAAAVSGVLLQ